MAQKKATATAQQENNVSTSTFSEKLQAMNVYLEELRIFTEVAKKLTQIEKLGKQDGKQEEVEKLKAEVKRLNDCYKDFKAIAGSPIDDITKDKFAFICAWSINPVLGEKYKDSNNIVTYDISFAGMYKPISLLKSYYKNWFDKSDSTEKQQAKRELATALDEFVNKYMPQVEQDKVLTPCEDNTVTLTFAKYKKDSTDLAQNEYKLPKNCMQDGYKPMKVTFVDTEERPMIKELATFCQKGLKWGKDGITAGKVDDYKIVQQIFLQALRSRLDFSEASTGAGKGTGRGIII